MPYLPAKPFNPVVSRVPILGPSSGNPQSLQDPHSLGSIGGKLQAMTDQANADRLYDAKVPAPTHEGFLGNSKQWIENTPSCKQGVWYSTFNKKYTPAMEYNMEGFTGGQSLVSSIVVSLIVVGIVLTVVSLR